MATNTQKNMSFFLSSLSLLLLLLSLMFFIFGGSFVFVHMATFACIEIFYILTGFFFLILWRP